MCSGTVSNNLLLPSVAFPPASSIIKLIGKTSYKSLNLPLGDLLSAGYMKIPPYSNVLWTSETMDPTYLKEYGLPSSGFLTEFTNSVTAESQYSEFPSLTE
ncbi:unnamed protein product [Blepharisma stoltei]|uniref:Uncharacterized protein n=1 Tax=Blepharisma stoltei TaxID=1481888 RepID=A0AAU9JS47_9CILI|nr:unnamed protein product [Blepharisma stoltei]